VKARSAATFALASLLAACTPACMSTGAFDGHTYRGAGFGFTVPAIPEGWHRVELTDAALAFRDDARAASILVNAKCGSKSDDVPLASLTEHLIIGTTERTFLEEATVPMDGREARHTILVAKLDGVPMQFDIYVMKKNGCVFDFVYVAEPQMFVEGSAAFEKFVRGVHTTGPGEP
jgi:hypothetical protein